MKYRICKNKYGYYKIQEYRLCCKEFSNIFVEIYECLKGNAMEYKWRNIPAFELYETKEQCEEKIIELQKIYKEEEQKYNQEWECEGEYE